jgi:hypothetical protein
MKLENSLLSKNYLILFIINPETCKKLIFLSKLTYIYIHIYIYTYTYILVIKMYLIFLIYEILF